jgi:hypothetical protein
VILQIYFLFSFPEEMGIRRGKSSSFPDDFRAPWSYHYIFANASKSERQDHRTTGSVEGGELEK